MEREAFSGSLATNIDRVALARGPAVRTILAPQSPGLSSAYCGEIVADEERAGRCPAADKSPTASPRQDSRGPFRPKGVTRPEGWRFPPRPLFLGVREVTYLDG